MSTVSYQLKPSYQGSFTGGSATVDPNRTLDIDSELAAGAGTITVDAADLQLVAALDAYPALQRSGATESPPPVAYRAETPLVTRPIPATAGLVPTLQADGSWVAQPQTGGDGGGTGTPGSRWYNGAGTPIAATGIVGDWYLNTTNGDVYEKTGASAWTLRLNITGPQGTAGSPGAAGAAGSKWYSGSSTPAAGTGVVGDWYLNTTTADVSEKTGASAWTTRLNIKGPAGAGAAVQGAVGDRLLTLGSQATPVTATTATIDFTDAANSVTSRSLYVVFWLGNGCAISITNLPAGPSACTIEVHQVGGPWSATWKIGGTTGPVSAGGTGIALTQTAGAVDVITLFSPDGQSLRGQISRDWK